MPILQHYYTSFINKETKSAGFQVKAFSPDLSPEIQFTIARLITYRIPSSYYQLEVSTHPIALRYLYQPGQESILLCSQSNGNDENGRPGNFFAHTLVMESDTFISVPPIFYWHSAFWCKRDPGPSRMLAPLERAQMEPALDIEEVWRFLAPSERRAQFFRLMCAIVQSKRTQRRIVIIDTADNVALWVAAVSAVLPPLYRPLLSFATYHHDPYQSPFLITGTTNDSFFQALPEEYMTYFILNASLGKVSEVAPSSYAEMAVNAASSNFYETQLLPIFSRYAIRFPQPAAIDESLDQIVAYARIYSLRMGDTFTEDMLQATATALSTFEQIKPSHYKHVEISELSQLAHILLYAYKKKNHTLIKRFYMRTNILLGQLIEPRDENIVELLKFCTESFLENTTELKQVALTIDDLRRLYPDDMLTICINSTAYLRYLDRFLTSANTLFLLFCWQHLGSYLMPSPHTQPLLLTSLCAFNELWEQKRSGDSGKLLQAMSYAFTAHNQGPYWFSCAVEIYDRLPKKTLELFYRQFVRSLELNLRIPYRRIVQPVIHNIIIAEIKDDIRNSTPEGAWHQLKCWAEHGRHVPLEPANLIQMYGLPELERRCPEQQWQELLPALLMSDEIAPLLSSELKNTYLRSAFATASFASFSEEKVNLYKKYQDDPTLSSDTHVVASILIDLASRQVDTQKMHLLHTYIQKIPHDKYCLEVYDCLYKVFTADISKDMHNQIIQALFVPTLRDDFWKAYWEHLLALLTRPAYIVRALDVFSYWFMMLETPTDFQHGFVLPDFFLQLPFELSRIKKSSDRYHELVAAIDRKAIQRTWYPSIRSFLVQPKTSLWPPFTPSTFPQNPKKGESEQVSKHFLSAAVADIFEHSHLTTRELLREYHMKNIALVYNLQQSKLFWRSYWGEIEKLLIQCQKSKKEDLFQYTNMLLALFVFWFDDARHVLGHVPYVVPEFFLEIPRYLLMFHKNFDMKGIFQLMDETCKNDPEYYAWWPLIKAIINTRSN